MQYGNYFYAKRTRRGTRGFKSYYVVWKLNDSEKYYERDNEGLNRTMQYGNPWRQPLIHPGSDV